MGLWCVRGAKQGRGKASGLSVGKTPQAHLQRTSQERKKVWSGHLRFSCIFTLVYTLSCCIKFIFHQVGMNQTLLWMGLPSSASLWRKSRRDTGRKKTNLRRPSPRIYRSVPQIFLQSVSPLNSGSFLWLLFFFLLGASASLASAEEMSLKLIIICTLLQTVDN